MPITCTAKHSNFNGQGIISPFGRLKVASKVLIDSRNVLIDDVAEILSTLACIYFYLIIAEWPKGIINDSLLSATK